MRTDRAWVVELDHRVPGSPEEVFEYFVDAEKFARWQGVEVELDPRPGGIFEISSIPDVWTRGEYVEVERPTRIVLTWGFETKGPPLPRGLAQVPAGSSTMEITLTPDGDETIVHVHHSGLPSEDAHFAHEQGWLIYLPRLTTVCAGGDPGEDPVLKLAAKLFAHDEETPT